MGPDEAKARFDALLAEAGLALGSLRPSEGLDLMLRHYEGSPDAGHLTCAWGVVTRYGAREFGFSMGRFLETRTDEGPETVGHLALKFKFGPREVAGEFPGWMKWCTRREEMDAFRAGVESSPPFQEWGRSRARDIVLVAEDIGDWTHALFDCWGVRDSSRPVVRMSEEEWLTTDDVGRMLRWFRQNWCGVEAELDRLIQRYLLRSCRMIWPLLPDARSRSGVEAAERHAVGELTDEEFHWAAYAYQAEGAAFGFDFNITREAIERWTEEAARIPPEQLARMLNRPGPDDDLTPFGLLRAAAHFVVSAMCYPGLQPKETIEKDRLFLSTSLLREVVGNPFRSAKG